MKCPTGKGFCRVHWVKCCPIQTDVSDGMKTGETCQFENRGCMQCSVMPSHRQRVLSRALGKVLPHPDRCQRRRENPGNLPV